MMAVPAQAAVWPDAPWINGPPRSDATVTAVAFVSPVDLQFQRLMHVWQKLQKKYGPYNVDFLIVAMQEPLLPFSDEIVQSTVQGAAYNLPVLIDNGARYAKLWRAYVSPTVDLVLRAGKVTSFDPGNFDPLVFEKTLQRLLKENGALSLPSKEYASEPDMKNCGHPHTSFLGDKFFKAWGSSPVTMTGAWSLQDYWLTKMGNESARLDVPVTRTSVGILAESTKAPARINVLLDGQKLPPDLKGRDVLEDKTGLTYINVTGPRMYEVIIHSGKIKDPASKLELTSDSKNLKVWAIETLPSCQDPSL